MTEETARLRNEVITILLQMQRIAGTEADRIDEDEKGIDTFHVSVTAMALQACAETVMELVQ